MSLIARNEPLAEKRNVPIYLVLDSDGKTPATGLTFTGSDIQVSKNSGALVNFGGAVTELAGGLYKYQASTDEVDALGQLILHINKATVRVSNFQIDIIDGSDFFVPLKMPGGFVERTGITSGNVTRAGYPDYAVLFSTSTSPDKLEFDPQLLVGALIKLSAIPDNNDQTSFIILGGYFFDDSDDKSRSVFGIALEERFGVKEEGEIFTNTNWAGTQIVEPTNGSGWTFILAPTNGGDSTFPGSGDAISIFAFPATQNQVNKEHGTELFIDAGNGLDTEIFPAGNKRQPVKTKQNLSIISDATGIDRYVVSSFPIPVSDLTDLGDGKTIVGDGTQEIYYEATSAGSGPSNCVFDGLIIRDGSNSKSNNTFRKCVFKNQAQNLGTGAKLYDCLINHQIAVGDLGRFIGCEFSNVGGLTGSIDLNLLSGPDNVEVFGGKGALSIINLTAGTLNVYGFQGDVTILGTCTGGTINLFSVGGRVTDNSGAGCTVNIFNIATSGDIGIAFSNQRMDKISYDDFGNPTAYVLKIYANATDAQNDATPTKTFNVANTYRKDPSNTNRFELVNKLMTEV